MRQRNDGLAPSSFKRFVILGLDELSVAVVVFDQPLIHQVTGLVSVALTMQESQTTYALLGRLVEWRDSDCLFLAVKGQGELLASVTRNTAVDEISTGRRSRHCFRRNNWV
jgi:hypothetical protein